MFILNIFLGQQRRLYFGNIPGHVNEQELMDFVNNTMISSGTVNQKGNPVQAVVINRDKVRWSF